MTTLRSLPRRTLAGLVTLSAAAFIAVTTETLPTGLLPQIGAGLHVSRAQAGLLIGVYALVVAVGSVPLAIATNRMPRKALILFTLSTYAASCVLVTVTNSFPVALGARAVGGVAHALFFAVASAYTTRLVPPALVGRAMAVLQTGGSLALVLGVPLGTAIGVATGWRNAFLVLAIASLVLVGCSAKLLPPVASSDPVSWPQAVGGLRAPGLRAIATVSILAFAAHYASYTYISPLLRRGGISTNGVSLVLLLFGFGGLLGVWLSGRSADRRPVRGLVAILVALPCALLGLALFSGSPVGTTLSAVVWSIAFVGAPTFIMTAALRAGHRQPDMAAAMINSACNIGIASGAVIGGLTLTVTGVAGAPVVSAVLFLVALAVTVRHRGAFSLPSQRPVTVPEQSTETVVVVSSSSR